MIAFIDTNIGRINLKVVKRFCGPDGRTIELTDGSFAEARNDPDTTIVGMLPAEGEFEVITDCSDKSNPGDFWVEPVIAWAVRLDGTIVPITPAEPAGDWGKTPLVRRKGESAVFEPGGGYLSIGDYFDEQRVYAVRNAG